MHLVGRKVCSIFENSLLPARLFVLMHVEHTIPYLYIQPLPEYEPLGPKHVEDIKKLKIKLLL